MSALTVDAPLKFVWCVRLRSALIKSEQLLSAVLLVSSILIAVISIRLPETKRSLG